MRTCPQCGKQFEDGVAYCESDGTRLSTIDQTDSPVNTNVGRVLGSYRLVQLIGEGGMGQVYLAEHTRLGRKVALKLLRPEYARHTKAVQRFFGEARAVNQISNDNIVEITDFIENEVDADGKPAEKYYIMELLKGRSLGDLQKTDGILPLERTLPIMMQVCSALAAVHDAGIVHRDLKPDNIFLIEKAGQRDFVKLLDFGVAKFTDLSASQQMGRTGVGALVGTPEYMSPEQMSGKPVDHRSDIYALGIILYEVVTGRQPFTAKSLGEMAIKHLTVTPPKPSKLKGLPHNPSRELEALIMECLQKDPLKRPQTVTDIIERMQPLVRDVAFADSSIDGPLRRTRNTRVAVVAAAVLAIGGGAGIAAVRTSKGEVATEVTAQPVVGAPAAEPTDIGLELEALPPHVDHKAQIALDSNPSGAEVYRENSDTLLGVTPFILVIEKSPIGAVLEFRRSGYKLQKETIAVENDGRFTAQLAKIVAEKTTAPPTIKPSSNDRPSNSGEPSARGTLDPFAN
ncbi:MAG: serine/threonine protein kinase [Clostridia bacterium]|nr:serine/threonine protein kinase [Deltaproteobacteria bacterium]